MPVWFLWKPRHPLQDSSVWVSVPPSYFAFRNWNLDCFDLKFWVFLCLHRLPRQGEVNCFSRRWNFFFFFALDKFMTYYLVIFDVTFPGHSHPSPQYGAAKSLYPGKGATCLPLIFRICGKMFIKILWSRKHSERRGHKRMGFSLKLNYLHLGVCIRCLHVRYASRLPQQWIEMQLCDAGWAFLLPYSCQSLWGQEWTGLVSYHPAPCGRVRYPTPPQKAVGVFICTSWTCSQHRRSSPESAKQTQVLGFRGNRIPLQPHQLCRPNLGLLWCSLGCPWRHLWFCASPGCNREVGYLKEWCQQLKVTLFCYHLETSRVWINSGHSMQFFSSSL